MDLQNEWQHLNAEIKEKNKEQYKWSVQLDAESHSLLQSLLFKLKWKLRWIRIIDIPILIAALFTKGDLQLVLIFTFITYELGRIIGRNHFNKIKTGVDYASSTKQVLIENHKAIVKILSGEKTWGYLFLPLSGPIGFIVYRLTMVNDFNILFNSPHFILYICGLSLIGLPFIYLAQKMNDSIFKKPIIDLEEKIVELTHRD